MEFKNRHSLLVVISTVLTISCLLGAHRCMGCSDHDQDLYRLGSTHYSRGEWDFAIQRFEELLKTGSDETLKALGQFYLAESFVASKQLDRAQRQLQRFLKRYPDHRFANQALFRLGEVAYLLGHTELASTTLQKFAKKNVDHQLLEFALPYLGEIELKKGNLVGAAQHFEKSLRQNPHGSLAHEARFGLARALEKSNSIQQAVRFYQFLIDHPDSNRAPDSLMQIAKIHYRQKDLTKAKSLLQEFEAKYPASELANPVRYWQGRIHFDEQEFAQAAKYYQTALDDNPNSKIIPALRFELARSLTQLDRFADAIAQLKIVNAEFPKSDWADDSLLLNLQILRNHEQYQRALKLCRQFHQHYPDSDLMIHVLDSEAECQFALDHYVAAESLFSRLVALFPTLADHTLIKKGRFENWRYKLAVSQIKLSKDREAIYNLGAIDLENCDDETRSAALLAIASIHIQRNQLKEACQGLIEYVRLNPETESAAKCLIDISLLFAKRENFQAADQWVQKIRSNQARAETYVKIAEVAFARKQFVFASKWFSLGSRIPADSATRCRASMGQIWSLKELGNIESTIAAVDRLIQSFPACQQAAEALYLKAVLLERSGAMQQSIPVFEALAKKYPESKYSEQSLLSLANLYRKYNASKLPTLEVPISKQISSADSKRIDLLLYELAWILKDSGQLEKSSRCFSELVERFPKHQHGAEALLQIAVNELQANKIETGKRRLLALTQAQASPRVLATANYELGRIAFTEKRFDQAFQHMTAVWQRSPTSSQASAARYWAAEARYQAGKVGEANKLFSALATSGGKDSPNADRVQLRLAQINIKLENWEAAREIAERLVAKTPNQIRAAESHFVIGRAYSGLGLFSKARASFQKVLLDSDLKGSETAAMAQWMIGETYFHQEDYQAAIDAYQRTEILHAYPQWQAAALLQAGKCFERINQIKKAISHYQRLIKSHSDSRYVAEANERLQLLGQVTTAEKTQPRDRTYKQK